MNTLAPATTSKLIRRIGWTTAFLFAWAYIDRVNVGLVAVQMNKDLGLSPAAFGFGASIFFAGYALFEVPSNIFLHKFGARLWIGRIMITWGILASAMAFIQGEYSFYVLRFLIGVAEAGFQPGIVFYLSLWFPNNERGRAIATFNSAIPLAIIFAAPITGWLLTSTDQILGFAGWRWVFILEGLPSIIFGIWTLFNLPESPRTATWLEPTERGQLTAILEAEKASSESKRRYGMFEWVREPMIWAYGLLFFLLAGCGYGVVFWLPQIVAGMGQLTPLQVGLITALPFLSAFIFMRMIGGYSDRTGNRKHVVAACALAAGLALLGSAFIPMPIVALACLCVTAIGIWSSYNPFWAMPSAALTGAALATGLAFLNSIGQVGGLVTPYMIGLIRTATNSYQLGLTAIAVMCLIAAVVALFVRDRAPKAM
jgi:MFS family permease